MRAGLPVTLLALAALAVAACDARAPAESGGGGQPTTGSHPAHLGGAIAEPVGCQECHDRAFNVTLGGDLATANGAQGSFNATTLTCSGVYCHDGGPRLPIGGGTTPAPVWNPPVALGCGGCHAPPGGAVPTPWHPAVASGVQCALCHPGYTNSTVPPGADKRIHVNGVADIAPATMTSSCAACHGDPTRAVPPGTPDDQADLIRAAPPVDRNGGTSTALPGVGAHVAHVAPGSSAISAPVQCSACHVVPSSADRYSHVGPQADTPATLDFSGLATANGAQASWDGTRATCANYCHGETLTGGANQTPVWTIVDGTQAACGSCHGNPPTSGSHTQHALPNWYNVSCGTCHPAGYALGVVAPQAVPVHVNGVTNMNADPAPGAPSFLNWNPDAPGPNGFRGTATGCHGGTRYWTPGAAGGSCG